MIQFQFFTPLFTLPNIHEHSLRSMLVTDPPEHSTNIQLQVRLPDCEAVPHPMVDVSLKRQAAHELALQAGLDEDHVFMMVAARESREMSVAARMASRNANIGPWSCKVGYCPG